VPSVLINLVDVFLIMRRFNIDGQIKRVIGELAETSGMERNIVLLSSLWSYDFSRHEFHQSEISGMYRDRLAQISGRSPKEIIEEVKLRTRILKALLEKNITDFFEVTKFCHKYLNHPQALIKELNIQ